MLIRRVGGVSWHTPHTTAYTNEGELRDLLVETPSLLPGIDDGPAAAAKEMPISGTGKADVVIVDAGGEITVVECKLRANREIRRHVVGQLLAYASAISQMRFADLDGAFRRSKARTSLFDALVRDDDIDEEEFRSAVDENLQSGSMRLIIAVDEITDELKHTVTYLNSNTTTNVKFLALEMRWAEGEGVEVLLPETYGEESVRERDRVSRGQRLDRETLLASIREHSESAAHAAEGILDWADGEPRLSVRYTPAAGVRFQAEGKPLLQIGRRGQLAVFLKAWDDGRVEQLARDLANFGIHLDATRARPRAPLDPLADEATRTQFFALMDRVLGALTSSP
jgi:hypothetical protein